MIENKCLIKVLVSTIIFLGFSCLSFADTVYLKSGKKLEGKIIEKTDKYIKIYFDGVTLTCWLDEIERIEEAPPLSTNAEKKGALVVVGDATLTYASYFFILPPDWIPEMDNYLLAMTHKKGFWRGRHKDSQAWILIAPTKTDGENFEFIKTSKDVIALGGCSLNNYNFTPPFSYSYEVYLEHCPKTGVGNRYGLIIFAKLPTHVIQFNLYATGENENCLTPYLEDFNKVIASFRWILGLSDEEIGRMLKE